MYVTCVAVIAPTAHTIRDTLKSQHGILITAIDAHRIRFVTHWQITRVHVDTVLSKFKSVIV